MKPPNKNVGGVYYRDADSSITGEIAANPILSKSTTPNHLPDSTKTPTTEKGTIMRRTASSTAKDVKKDKKIPFGIYFEKRVRDEELKLMSTNTRSMDDCDTSTTNHSTEDNDT